MKIFESKDDLNRNKTHINNIIKWMNGPADYIHVICEYNPWVYMNDKLHTINTEKFNTDYDFIGWEIETLTKQEYFKRKLMGK